METTIKFVKPNVFNFGEDWKDYYVQIKDLRKGDVFYECSKDGENFELKVLENPKKTQEGWFCLVETSKKEVFDFFVSSNTSYNGPNLFWAPIHLSQLEDGEFMYVIK
jgi:hypothetical protein